MRVIMVTCGTVLMLICIAFFVYEFITYRAITKRELSTLGKIVAANSTSSLAFDDKKDADEILSALKAEPHIIAAALYDRRGKLYAFYPHTLDPAQLPPTVLRQGYSFQGDELSGFEPVVQGTVPQGTLYLKSDMKEVYNRFTLYGVIGLVFIAISIVLAYPISKRLQESISAPILELAETARIVSEERDYSVRANKISNDELGRLTDAFNHMLTEIQMQSDEIKALNAGLEEKVSIRTQELQNANDILKQQNEFIQTIIDSSVDVIAVINKEMEYVILNKVADTIYPIKRDDIIGKKILDVFPAVRASPLIPHLERALKGEFIHIDAIKSLVSDRYFENFFIPLKDKNGNTDRVLIIGHDITSIMQANEKLKLVNAELEKSNRDLEQFAYIASHDLQEPLRKIQTFSELSERNTQHPEIQKRYLQKINSSAGRMSELIRAVLNYSKLSRTGQDFSMVDLNAIVKNIRTDLELVIEEKKAVITTGDLPAIWGNALQLHQLFLNLISNSLKFSDQAPEITITAGEASGSHAKKPALQNGKYWELVFADNGIGFESQYAVQIFDIFQRLHSGSEYTGTGIGLALCKKIVENHHGFITAESELGKGTRFYVYLPV